MSVILNIEGIDFEKSNVIFVNGMSLERVKIKYNWLLNAKVKDAIVGENERGLVWYFGDWFCGEWEDGTWYSGNFNGIWKNGLFFSYQLDKFDVLSEVFFIKQYGNQYSTFESGLWISGTFYSGTFGISGNTEDWTDFEQYNEEYEGYSYINFEKSISSIGGSLQYEKKSVPVWMDGIFEDGLFYNSIWMNGRHKNGNKINSMWLNGMWFDGIFDGNTWFDGQWYNGEFINGNWMNGTFSQLRKDIVSRFGNTILDTTGNTSICNWYDGTWKSGEWFSGYEINSNGQIIDTNKNYLSIWYDGTWRNGTWYGGHFKKGTWEKGIWLNGIFGNLDATDWTTPIYVSQIDTRMEYKWSGDTINPTQTTSSSLVSAINSANTYYEISHFIQDIDIVVTSYTASTSAITFTQSNYVTFERDIYDFIQSTGITNYYNFVEIGTDCRYVLDGINYTINNISNVSTGVWTAIVDNLSTISNVPSDQSVIVRRNVVLNEGSGSGTTYWSFNDIKTKLYDLTFNLVQFIGNQIPDFIVGDYVVIEQDSGAINTSYNGIGRVIETGTTGSQYYILVSKKYKQNTSNGGKLIKYVGLMSYRDSITTPPISFQDFDFNYNFITDIDNVLINGYVIRFDTNVNLDNSYRSPYKNVYASLPFKDLYLESIDSFGNKNYGSFDYCYYPQSIYSGHTSLGYPNIPLSKNRYTTINNNSTTGVNKTYYLGSFDDMWGLVDDQNRGLETYYDEPGFDKDLYNPRLPITSGERLRISLAFLMEYPISQILRISNLQIKVYYSNQIDVPVWKNGTWYKGTWYNGDFYDGDFLSGMWIKGNFLGGNLASDYR